MQLKLNCHKLKIDYYTYSMFQVSLRVNTKQKPTADTHKIEKKESKCTTTENHQLTKEYSKRGRKEQENYKTARKQQDSNSWFLPINNYFKCTWSKSTEWVKG